MRRNRLMASIAMGLFASAGVAQAADGWYVAPSVGYYHSDSDRNTEEGSVFGALGIGKYFGNNASIEFSVDRTTRNNLPKSTANGHWTNMGMSLTYRQFFGSGDFKPYILVGGGANNHRRDTSENGWDFMAQAGAGLSYDFSPRVRGRAEAFYRHDMDGESLPNNSSYGDWVLALGVQIALGQVEVPVEPEPYTPPPPPPEPHCSELDSDGDGVNDCDDRCPNTPAGTVVGPDGCPLPVAIDLRGVEFDFDKSTLRPESRQTLDEATEVLRQYPDIRVEVAGHTDSIGSDQYNQGLSERRAQAVYDYLVGNGIDSGRLNARGYGENSPIADNATREGRQRNRRVELVVQN